LWVRALRGQRLTKEPWFIVINKELGDILEGVKARAISASDEKMDGGCI
jgi:hypothetical protein